MGGGDSFSRVERVEEGGSRVRGAARLSQPAYHTALRHMAQTERHRRFLCRNMTRRLTTSVCLAYCLALLAMDLSNSFTIMLFSVV